MELENTENLEANATTNIEEEGSKAKVDRKPSFNEKDPNSRKKFFKKKVCYFCKNDIDVLDYKDIKLLKRYVKESGKIMPKRLNGTCSKHQRLVTKAIKRARNIALLPYETKY